MNIISKLTFDDLNIYIFYAQIIVLMNNFTYILDSAGGQNVCK